MSKKGLVILDAVLTAGMALMAAVGVALGRCSLEAAVVAFVIADVGVDTAVLSLLQK